jgi:hypothetical protein
MKPRHATAIALVGWYLMVPPLHSVSKTMAWDSSAPLSKWMIVDSFDTAEECRHDLLRRINSNYKGQTPTAAEKRWLDKFVCIASDDPRLVK